MSYTNGLDDPSAYFHTHLYTGNNSDRSETNDANAGDFQPDWVWIKARSEVKAGRIFDSSRGATKVMYPSATNAEGTTATSLTSFDSDGFSLGSSDGINKNTITYVAWQWKANGGTTTTNNDGTVSVTLQANTTAGFSIGLWTSDGTTSGTIGHGLGARPDMIITKERNDTGNWNVIVPDYAGNEMGQLNTTNAFGAASGINTVGTSTFTDGDGADGNTRVFYAFKSIQGYSKIGVYTGNGNADGAFVYTGFQPAYFLVKNTSTSSAWRIYSNKISNQSGFNDLDVCLFANTSEAETGTGHPVDFVSNGIKMRGTNEDINQSGNTFVYLAFAEHPFVSSEGVPTTAR